MQEKDLQNKYVQEELNLHGEFLTDLFIEAIDEKTLIDSGSLKADFTGKNQSTVFERGTFHVLQFTFANHGRFIEIRNSKKHSRIKTEKEETNATLWGIRASKNKKGKNAQWYTRNVYGAQNRLIGRLMYGLGDKERERLTNLLQRENKMVVNV